MNPKDLSIEDYTYLLPDERIARYPLSERDASKLLIYNKGSITEDTYKNIATHIPEGALILFNQTKVVHARLLFKKPSGGTIEVFCLGPHPHYADIQSAMLTRQAVVWECLVGGASKWKDGTVLQINNLSPRFTLCARKQEHTSGAFFICLEWDDEEMTFGEVLHYAGSVPLPPYLKRDAVADDETRYQTLFARENGSVAAPTAGLHFTTDIMNSLHAKNITTDFVTLHVGAGTFKPVKASTMSAHEMHAEWMEVTRETITGLLTQEGKNIVAVGTTSLRTLESLYWIGNKLANSLPVDLNTISVTQWEPYETHIEVTTRAALQAILSYMTKHLLGKITTRTQILIAPGYRFRIATALVTNFHQPGSTLLLLVAAITGAEWRNIYEYALAHDFRFLSYGDGCLLWL